MITSKIPTQNKLPKGYIEYLYKVVNAEDTAEIEMPPIPPHQPQKMTFTEVSKRAFASCIGMFSV